MPWLQLRIDTSREHAARVEYALSRVDAQAITLSDNANYPIFEPAVGEMPLWEETRIVGLFPADTPTEDVLSKVCDALVIPLTNYQWQILEDKDWEREWMQDYQPIHCGTNLWICPSWLEPPEPDAINVKLDPGLAFGTGGHPTTLMCLNWLARTELAGKACIDYGCGSGILGIAALKLGARSCLGVDIDPQALFATRENLKRNNLPRKALEVFFPDALPLSSVDVIMANILAGPLIALAPTLQNLLKPGGVLCLSGITLEQKPSIERAYGNWLHFNHTDVTEEWICVAGHKKCV